jgi:extracellular factor (EF) 3-hydroxypalmitic acid methyl ester biosynthesis protein
MTARKGSGRAVDRRKGQRGEGADAGKEFIEIQHTYGSRKTSVYQLVERNEGGLSFLVPASEGYFLAQTPLRFSIVQQDTFRTQHVGVACYHYPVYSGEGEKFYRIGVEIDASLRDPPRKRYVLRPPRLVADRSRRASIEFRLGGRGYSFDLADFSRFNAAFICPLEDLPGLGISSLLSHVRIAVGEVPLFQGSAVITRVYADRQGRHRVAIEPRELPIDVERVKRVELSSSVHEQTSSLIRRHDSFQSIDSTFKAMVADLRFFLEDFKKYLETPLFQAEKEEQAALLEEIFPSFYSKLDSKITRLDTYAAGLSLEGEEKRLYKQYYQKNLLPLFLTAPYNHRVYFKPHGYPGDFEMMRMVHANLFEGATLFGKMMNKYSTTIPVARTVRERTIYFKDRLRREVEKTGSLSILSVASGPGLEFDLLLKEIPDSIAGLSITLLDQEIEAQHYSMDTLYERRLRAGSGVDIQFIHQGIGDYLRAVARKKVQERYDFIYSSGLFDYFDDKTCVFVIKRLLSLLKEGGRLVIANLSLEGHDHRIVMEFVHDWNLIYRSGDDLLRLARAVPKGRKARVTSIAEGMLSLLEIEG